MEAFIRYLRGYSMADKRDYSTILFTPEEAGAVTAAHLRERRENKNHAVPFGLKSMDVEDKDGNGYVPLMRGEVESVIARPGHGKTGTMVARARARAQFLKAQNLDKSRAVVYITLEQMIEELNAFNIAADRRMSITRMAKGEITDAEWKACLEEGISRRYMPIWNIGYSGAADRRQIRIDLDAIEGALKIIQDQHKMEIDLVFVDYLQRMPFDRAESKTIGVSDNLDGLKNLAMWKLKFPCVVGVQATRDVDARSKLGGNNLPIPGMDDGQWTSNIEQTSDHILSLVRPRKYRNEGETFGSVTVSGHCQILISVLKQKMGASNFARWEYYDPIFNKLDELEIQRAQP